MDLGNMSPGTVELGSMGTDGADSELSGDTTITIGITADGVTVDGEPVSNIGDALMAVLAAYKESTAGKAMDDVKAGYDEDELDIVAKPMAKPARFGM